MTSERLMGRWRNVGQDTVPAYGLVMVVGTFVEDNGAITYLCQTPDGKPNLHVVNQHAPVNPRRDGTYYLPEDHTHPLLLDPSRVPQLGARVGPQQGSYQASLNSDGWLVLRQTRHKNLVIATKGISSLGLFAIVETTEDHAEGDTQDCYVLSGTKGDEEKIPDPSPEPEDPEDPYVKIECYNRFGDLSAEQKAIAAYVVNGWEIMAASCEE